MSVLRWMHLPCLLLVDGTSHATWRPENLAFGFFISRYQASIVFAGGAITDGVWGSIRRVTGVTGVAHGINRLNLLSFVGVTRCSSFTCIGCYKPSRCYGSVYKNGSTIDRNRGKSSHLEWGYEVQGRSLPGSLLSATL
jgi:hypothetical protein